MSSSVPRLLPTADGFHDDGQVALLHGDVRDVLRRLAPDSIQACITSPPYWSLRDYGVEPSVWGGEPECAHEWGTESLLSQRLRNGAKGGLHEGRATDSLLVNTELSQGAFCRCGAWRGALGLEPTPEMFVEHMVEVFREVRRVLADDGTLWLNIGDSYASNPSGVPHGGQGMGTGRIDRSGAGLKPKDLVGIPWALAKALRDPYYAGRMKAERDRVWLAAVIDSEGCISGFTHDRADGGGRRTGVNITITNTSERLLAECHRIWPASQAQHENHGDGHLGGKPSWRWICHGTENRMLLLREIYPYLVAKRTQAILAYNLLNFMVDAKRMGKTPEAPAIHEKRALLARLISEANQGDGTVDIPSWCIEPPSALEQGWWLRQDIIWHKPNPMPESVTDRCTKAHEYLFLLTKSARYYYDADAIREASNGVKRDQIEARARRVGEGNKSNPGDFVNGIRLRKNHTVRATIDTKGGNQGNGYMEYPAYGRNKRSVWSIPTAPFPEAHFATFPPALVEPCILAGSREGDTILDPFVGSGTTAMVARRLGRRAVGIDLNPDYLAMAVKRCGQMSLELTGATQ